MSDVARCVRLGVVAAVLGAGVVAARARGDGMVVPPRDYKGSLEERRQEAMILFHAGDETRPATEDLILKIRVKGDAASFAWVVALPERADTAPEDPALFEELHRYVQDPDRSKASEHPSRRGEVGGAGTARRRSPAAGRGDLAQGRRQLRRGGRPREGARGARRWLADNGYRRVEAGRGPVRRRIARRVTSSPASGSTTPRRRRASRPTCTRSGSRSRPGAATGSTSRCGSRASSPAPFDVNLYVFYDKWINDRINGFGYAHRGFALHWRDYDGPECTPNAGKRWSDPSADPYLGPFAAIVPTVTKLCQKLHPGARYYLTNLRADRAGPPPTSATGPKTSGSSRTTPTRRWSPTTPARTARRRRPIPTPSRWSPPRRPAKRMAPLALAALAVGLPVVAIVLVARRSRGRAGAP